MHSYCHLCLNGAGQTDCICRFSALYFLRSNVFRQGVKGIYHPRNRFLFIKIGKYGKINTGEYQNETQRKSQYSCQLFFHVHLDEQMQKKVVNKDKNDRENKYRVFQEWMSPAP